jgi:hypothetical protein
VVGTVLGTEVSIESVLWDLVWCSCGIEVYELKFNERSTKSSWIGVTVLALPTSCLL